MNHRPFRIILLLSVLLCLVAVPGIVTARAIAPSTHAGLNLKTARHSIKPAGHGVAVPQRVSTNAMPQVHAPQSTTGISIQEPDSSSSQRASVPYPSNVVDVPAPASTDPSAKTGLSKQGFKPDANGAGGYYNYLETVNGEFAVYSRTGTRQFVTTFQNWYGTTNTYYDPVTMWDDTGGRFIFSILQSNTTNLMLSVAQQSNGTGSYCNYTFSTLSIHDFDKLGVDADGIYFSVNVLSKTGSVVGNELFYASRTALESCQSATYSYWTNLTNPDGTIAQAITPARQDSSVSGVEYLVNSIPAGACQLTLWSLTSSGTLSNTSVATQCYSPPPAAPQLGSAALIDAGDSSITQASLVNGLLTVDNLGSYDWGDGNGPVGIVEWYQLNPSTDSVANQGAFGTPGYWLFYPSTITTANGHMLFVYNASGPSIYPSVWYVNQSMTNTTALANGIGSYGTKGTASWGDYQSAWPDTSKKSSNSVWITGEYGISSTNWGTKFDLITP